MRTYFPMMAVLLSTMIGPNAFAVSEKDLESVYQSQIVTFFETGVTGVVYGSNRSAKEVALVYHSFHQENEVGAIVLIPGRTEASIKYAEMVYDLFQKGYSVYIMDVRGQGESDRMTGNPEIGYVRDFDDYADDEKIFFDKVVNEYPHSKRYIVAHSMGGAIALRFEAKYPGQVDALALSSPMIKVKTQIFHNPIENFVFHEEEAKAWAELNCLFRCKSYANGQHDWSINDRNSTTSSQVRYKLSVTGPFVSNPRLQVGGASFSWVREAIAKSQKIRKYAAAVTAPVLIMQAGMDQLVMPDGQREFCSKAKNCTLVTEGFEGAQHDLFGERDEIRDRAMADTLDFISRH